jgi:hypothetical protein
MDDFRNTLLAGALNSPFGDLIKQVSPLAEKIETVTKAVENYGEIVDRILGGEFGNGQERWDIGMTAAGINAKTITAGRLNTGEVIIMNGDHPTFRWDSKGITAYSFATEVNEETGIETDSDYNYNKGVRFDRFGLYGYDGQGQTWAPRDLEEIRQKSRFALTWDGLVFRMGGGQYDKYYGVDSDGNLNKEFSTLTNPITHSSTVDLGRTNGLIYNAWNKAGYPYYNPNSDAQKFTKIFAVGPGEKQENLVIYDDGTMVANNIKLNGSIEWTEASSPSKTVYATAAYVGGSAKDKNHPADGTKYKDISDSGTGWHRVSGTNDSYYATTDNGGATWQGPFLITGKSIVNTVIEYKIDAAGKDPASVTGWSKSYPTNSPGVG